MLLLYGVISVSEDVKRVLVPAFYLPLFVFVALNWRRPGISVLGLGMALNFLAIVSNGGLMPVSPAHMREAGSEEKLAGLVPGDAIPDSLSVLLEPEDTDLEWLVDRFVWDSPGVFTVFSVGDVIIGLGLFAAAGELLIVFLFPALRRRASGA